MSTDQTAVSVLADSPKDIKAIDITALTRLKHADLWNAAKLFSTPRYGGQAALARRLGVTVRDISNWINLRDCPPRHVTKTWTEERLYKLECDLAEITGKSLDELFPDALRDNVEFFARPKVYERVIGVEQYALANYASATRERLLCSSDPRLAHTKQKNIESIRKSLSSLTYRECLVVSLRYGLDGIPPLTLDEIAGRLGVTKERIRQILQKAIRKLQRSPQILRIAEQA